jgi:hypothetical protein
MSLEAMKTKVNAAKALLNEVSVIIEYDRLENYKESVRSVIKGFTKMYQISPPVKSEIYLFDVNSSDFIGTQEVDDFFKSFTDVGMVLTLIFNGYKL